MLVSTYLTIQAVAIVTIQLQLLTSGSMATTATTRALLFIGMTLELLAILLAISFPQFQQYPEEHHPLQRRAAVVPSWKFTFRNLCRGQDRCRSKCSSCP
jgi:hypothetical protein